jgi:hypothetical protein
MDDFLAIGGDPDGPTPRRRSFESPDKSPIKNLQSPTNQQSTIKNLEIALVLVAMLAGGGVLLGGADAANAAARSTVAPAHLSRGR